MSESSEFKDGFSLGRIESSLETLKETCARIEAGQVRSGERIGILEKGQADCDKHNAVMTTTVETMDKDISDLKGSRKWFITVIVGGFLAALWQLVVKYK